MSAVASSRLFLPHQTFADDGARRTPVSSEALRQAYEHIKYQIVYEEETLATGGRFPISANSWWHGGVHLTGRPASDQPVYACLDGTIVAACLAPAGTVSDPKHPTGATGYFGARNFILLRHTWEERPFFSLYMHLAPLGEGNMTVAAMQEHQIRWPLRPPAHQENGQGDSAQNGQNGSGQNGSGQNGTRQAPAPEAEGLLRTLAGGTVHHAPRTVKAGERLWLMGEYGPEATRTSLVHWEIFSAENLFADRVGASERTADAGSPDGRRAAAGNAAGSAAGNADAELRSVWAVAPTHGPSAARVGETVRYEATLNVDSPTAAERATIRWRLRLDGEPLSRPQHEEPDQLEDPSGTPLELTITEDMRGKTLAACPYGSTVEEALFAHTKVRALPPLQWREAEDPDGADPGDDAPPDFNMDAEAVHALLDPVRDLDGDGDEIVSAAELVQFFVLDEYEPEREALRGYACRFVSEWGLKNLEAAVDRIRTQSGGFWEAWAKAFYDWAERFAPYQWWEAAEAAGAPLPERPYVWHYHPVAFMQQLFEDGYGGDAPTFFVEREGEEVEVERPDDSTADDEGVSVFVREDNGEVWRIGRTEDYKSFRGLARDGDPDLYGMLIDPADIEGIPDLSNIDKRVWASLRKIEGGITAINSYDTAFLSVGPIQQTAGRKDWKGELQGALNYMKDNENDLYQHYFGRHGLDVTNVETQQGVDKGDFLVNGELAKSPSKKEQFRDLIWAWRWHEALSDPSFREPFLHYGFGRIEMIRNCEATTEITLAGNADEIVIRLGDIFTTDVAQALIMGAHINYPAIIYTTPNYTDNSNIWVNHVGALLESKGTNDTSQITLNEECRLIKDVIHGRNASRMTNPTGRASKILACASDDALQKLAQANGDTGPKAFCADLGLSYAVVSQDGHDVLEL